MENLNNKNVVLVLGRPSTGKTTSLMYIPNQEKIAYLNADLKALPFQSKFKNVDLVDPKLILTAISQIEASDSIEGAVLDTITFLMNQFERQYVATHKNAKGVIDTMAGWGEYSKFYSTFMHAIKGGTKNYAILAHDSDVYNEKDLVVETKVPIKGAVGKIGVEADFTTIIATKRMTIAALEPYENDLLRITDEELEDGFKYVFQTRITAGNIGEKIRSAMGLWDRSELYIDNNLSNVFKRLNSYYNS
jgi:hypothetical protein